MGIFSSTNSNVDMEITKDKITNLEGEIKIMKNQKSNIIEIFNDILNLPAQKILNILLMK